MNNVSPHILVLDIGIGFDDSAVIIGMVVIFVFNTMNAISPDEILNDVI